MKRWLPLVVFLVLVGFFAKGLFLNPREVPSPFIGRTAPAFTLPLVQDPSSTFSPADMKGQVWVMNVWAPWCVSCRQEHPLLMQIAQNGGVPIVGLNWKDKAREARDLLARARRVICWHVPATPISRCRRISTARSASTMA